MLCEKFMKQDKSQTLNGRFTHYEDNGFLYFNQKGDNDLERHCIYSCLAKLNDSYSKENNFYRNYLYLQEIDYKLGDIYAAIYPQDKMFYRVKILQFLDFEKVLVSFVDYGNSEIISKSELAPLPHEISIIKPLALLCKIPNVKLISEKSFMKVIRELCLFDMQITVEFRASLTTVSDSGMAEKSVLHLINFKYRDLPIRDYLLKNKVAIDVDEQFETLSLWPYGDEGILGTQLAVSCPMENNNKNDNNATPIETSPHMEYTKTVIITNVTVDCDIFVHEFCKNVKNKLEALQLHIGRAVEIFKSRLTDNMFNKRNMYLTQFSEDMMWYRCRISSFDPANGFLVQYIDFGNSEYKNSLSELILLTRDMGSDALFLINEEPIAQVCQFSQDTVKIFPSGTHIRKFLTKTFVEPVKKVSITYYITEDPTTVWIIKNMSYHNQDLCELLDKQCHLKDGLPKNLDGVSETSSHSIHNVADIKVADYLLNGCPELPDEFYTSMDSNRQYLVTHIGGIDELWIDIGDGQTQEMCDHLLSTMNQQSTVSEVIIDYIYGVKELTKEGKSVAVRCKIIDVKDNYIRVHLIDRGPTKNVLLDDIFKLSSEIVALPQQVLKFRFPENLKLKITEELVLDNLKSLLIGRYVRIVRESFQTNILIDLLLNNQSVLQTLISKNMAYLYDINNWFQLPKHVLCFNSKINEIRSKRNPHSLYSI